MDTNSTRLVQLIHPDKGRRIALVNEPELILIGEFTSVYELALAAIDKSVKLTELIKVSLSAEKLDYNEVYDCKDDWKLLPAFDHPEGPFGCMVAGTGLTHKNSALNRQMMHQSDNKPTDSMQMYQWGVEGGFPEKGQIGVQPEWFYKGNGHVLKAHGESLSVPCYGNDGGEEPEVAGIYIIDRKGQPFRIGFSTGNEFSDHVMEKKNYLYLAPSKLRECSIGPEICITDDFSGFEGKVSVSRKDETIWSADIQTGEKNMAHNLQNLEYHHFKYSAHRIPLQAHVHFFGADAFSFGNGIKLENGDLMEVEWKRLGRGLKNYITIVEEEERLIEVRTI
ncbi:MAG: GguC protein [Pyrinomonadaceae bacterium]|nr:GguC protein [Sphingobacteriaceae bacterium]